jgi:hypothetical protein
MQLQQEPRFVFARADASSDRQQDCRGVWRQRGAKNAFKKSRYHIEKPIIFILTRKAQDKINIGKVEEKRRSFPQVTELVSVDSDVGALHVGAAAESSLASTFELKTIVCQDRLGTK